MPGTILQILSESLFKRHIGQQDLPFYAEEKFEDRLRVRAVPDHPKHREHNCDFHCVL